MGAGQQGAGVPGEDPKGRGLLSRRTAVVLNVQVLVASGSPRWVRSCQESEPYDMLRINVNPISPPLASVSTCRMSKRRAPHAWNSCPAGPARPDHWDRPLSLPCSIYLPAPCSLLSFPSPIWTLKRHHHHPQSRSLVRSCRPKFQYPRQRTPSSLDDAHETSPRRVLHSHTTHQRAQGCTVTMPAYKPQSTHVRVSSMQCILSE